MVPWVLGVGRFRCGGREQVLLQEQRPGSGPVGDAQQALVWSSPLGLHWESCLPRWHRCKYSRPVRVTHPRPPPVLNLP